MLTKTVAKAEGKAAVKARKRVAARIVKANKESVSEKERVGPYRHWLARRRRRMRNEGKKE